MNQSTSKDAIQRYQEAELISAKQARAIMLLIQGKMRKQIAADLEVSKRTISRWKNENEDFKRALIEQQKQMRERTERAIDEAENNTIYPHLIQKAEEEAENNGGIDYCIELLKASGRYGNRESRKRGTKDLLVENDTVEEAIVKRYRKYKASSPLAAKGFIAFINQVPENTLIELGKYVQENGNMEEIDVIDIKKKLTNGGHQEKEKQEKKEEEK